jgi:hypothetical protein
VQLILLQAVLSQEQVVGVEHIQVVLLIQAHLQELELEDLVVEVQVVLHQDQQV